MPLTLPDLDDRSYADLLTEARALIPALAPDWTDHNPADPGITLIELFAWFAEMLLYRVNQVTDNNRLAFLRLINGRDWKQTKSVAEEIRDTVVGLRKPARAVTAADFERIALGVPGVARASCVPRRNLELDSRRERAIDWPADVSLVVVPIREVGYAELLRRLLVIEGIEPLDSLLKKISDELEEPRLLTTRVHVVAARRVAIGLDLTVFDRAHEAGVIWRRPKAPDAAITLTLTIHARPDMSGRQLLQSAERELRRLFDPREGGSDGRGWPFGRAVYLSEIYRCLARLPGADYVAPTEGKPELAGEQWWYPAGELAASGIRLEPDELPQAAFATGNIVAHTPEDPARQRP